MYVDLLIFMTRRRRQKIGFVKRQPSCVSFPPSKYNNANAITVPDF